VSDGGHVWWEDAVVYEVYPRSFADADGDGVGDLPGLRSRLGYLADLGVDAIWLTPFYPSPLADGGYDVSDYGAVDPLLGTMADFDALVSGAAAHQIRVIIDLVPNHCSSAHPLFRAALAAAPGSDERARFVFSLYLASRTILEVMPKVRVPRKNVTPGEIVTVLSRRLGPGYQVESNGGRRVMVRKSPLMYASVSISDQPGASVFGVHGGGFFFLRLVNTFGTARRVADALRRSPEFRSL